MDDKKEAEILGRLEKFMRDTTAQIKALIIVIHNQQIDIDNLKKNLNQNRILVKN